MDLISPGFVQRPACGYTLNEVIGWSFNPSPSPPIQTDISKPYELLISSTTNTDAAVYTAKLKNAVTYNSQSWLPEIEFTITVIDPCLTTTLTPFTLGVIGAGDAYGTITQEAGVTVETPFNEPDDTAGTTVGDQSICGPKTYSIVKRSDDSAQSLVTI